MTVIAYKDGVMASDTQIIADDIKSHQTKVFARNGWLIGFAGDDCPPYKKMLAWFFSDQRGALHGYKFDLLCVDPNGRIKLLDQRGDAEIVNGSYYAIGSGAKVALGVLFTAKGTATEAVRAAIKHADGCGGRVRSVRR